METPEAVSPWWDSCKPGPNQAWLEQLAAVREVLTAGGRLNDQQLREIDALLHSQAQP